MRYLNSADKIENEPLKTTDTRLYTYQRRFDTVVEFRN